MPEIKFEPCPLCGKDVSVNETAREIFYKLLVDNGSTCIVVRCHECRLDLYEHADSEQEYKETLAKLADRWNSIPRKERIV